MLELMDLSIRYEETRILEAVQLRLNPGEISVISGASGCGKSSLIKVVNGIIPEMSAAKVTGEILMQGERLVTQSIAERSRHISTVFQNPKSQFFCVNAYDELAFALENQCLDPPKIRKRIAQYTELLGTEKLQNKQLFSLSGGEKQLLAITSVSCMNNALYLFDEPSAALDHVSIEKLKKALLTLKSLGKTILIAEHRLYYLRDILDHFYLIKEGRLEELELTTLQDDQLETYGLRRLSEIKKTELSEQPIEKKSLFSKDYDEKACLKCLDFKYAYKHSAELMSMNLSFDRGIYFIIGDNGIGKSTFIKAICGLLKSFKGKLYWENKRVYHPSSLISLVMQDVNYQLFTESVWDEMKLVTEDEEKIGQGLKQVGLEALKERHPQSLSGGEKQRLTLAQAYASPKPVIILDEPTSGLCRANLKRTVEMLHQLAQMGKCLLVATHDYELIQNCGGKILEFVEN